MDADIHGLIAVAQAYLDAAYDMDASRFASLFQPTSSVTKLDEAGAASAMPIEAWLAAVRALTSPRQRGEERADEILSVQVIGGLGVIALKLRVEPNLFTDLLSCAKVGSAWKIVQKVTTSRPARTP